MNMKIKLKSIFVVFDFEEVSSIAFAGRASMMDDVNNAVKNNSTIKIKSIHFLSKTTFQTI